VGRDQAGFKIDSPRREARNAAIILTILLAPFTVVRFSNPSGWLGPLSWFLLAVGLMLNVGYWYLVFRRNGLEGARFLPWGGWLSRRMADSLTQFDAKPPFPAGPVAGGGTAGFPAGPVAGGGTAGSPPAAVLTAAPTWGWQPGEEAAPTYYSTHSPPMDWHGLVQSVAARLEDELGVEFSVRAEEYSLVMRHGDLARRVALAGAFAPPPAREDERAIRGCLKMLDAAQVLAMRALQHRWPQQATAGGPLPRPHATVVDGELLLAFVDDRGPVLEFPPIPFAASGAPDGPVRGGAPGIW
jgi:hypothetical protein